MRFRYEDIGLYALKENNSKLLDEFAQTVTRMKHSQVEVARQTGMLQSTVSNLLKYKTYRYDFSRKTMFLVIDYVNKYAITDNKVTEPSVDVLSQVINTLQADGFEVTITLTKKV